MLKDVLELLLPTRCAGCGERGAACCPRCRSEFAGSRQIACGLSSGVPAFGLAAYRGAARQLVLAYKERGRRDLAPLLGRLLADAVGDLPGPGPPDAQVVLVPAPSARAASRVRGGPHVARLAGCCAATLAASGRPAAVAPALRLAAGVPDAVGLDAAHRAARVDGRVLPDPTGAPPAGTDVVLLDDVLTTGATARACIEALATIDVNVRAVLVLTSPRLGPVLQSTRNTGPLGGNGRVAPAGMR